MTESRRMTELVGVRFTPDDWRRVEAEAARCGVTVPKLLRQALDVLLNLRGVAADPAATVTAEDPKAEPRRIQRWPVKSSDTGDPIHNDVDSRKSPCQLGKVIVPDVRDTEARRASA